MAWREDVDEEGEADKVRCGGLMVEDGCGDWDSQSGRLTGHAKVRRNVQGRGRTAQAPE